MQSETDLDRRIADALEDATLMDPSNLTISTEVFSINIGFFMKYWSAASKVFSIKFVLILCVLIAGFVFNSYFIGTNETLGAFTQLKPFYYYVPWLLGGLAIMPTFMALSAGLMMLSLNQIDNKPTPENTIFNFFNYQTRLFYCAFYILVLFMICFFLAVVIPIYLHQSDLFREGYLIYVSNALSIISIVIGGFSFLYLITHYSCYKLLVVDKNMAHWDALQLSYNFTAKLWSNFFSLFAKDDLVRALQVKKIIFCLVDFSLINILTLRYTSYSSLLRCTIYRKFFPLED